MINYIFYNNMLRSYIQTNTKIPCEIEEGYIEYKQRLDHKDRNKIKKMASQMLWRLNEGKSCTGKTQAYYFLGIKDNGEIGNMEEKIIDASIEVLQEVSQKCQAEILSIDKIFIDNYCIAEVIVCKRAYGNFVKESRVCFLGLSGHGKTTIISHLTFNQLDNGNGLARSLIFKHIHEQNTGITSSIKHDIIGISNKKNIINYKYGTYCNWENIVLNSEKLIALTDLPGMNKFYRTTLYGIFSLRPHFNIIVISPFECQHDYELNIANEIINNIKICVFLNIPFFIVFTKSDLYIPDDEFISKINSIVNIFSQKRNLYRFVNKIDDDIYNIPYVFVSSISGDGFNNLIQLLDLYSEQINNKNKKSVNDIIKENSDVEFTIHDSYIIPDRGNVLYGILNSGKININDIYYLGPINQKFYPVTISNIHKKQIDSKNIYPDESASIEVKIQNGIELTKNIYIVQTEEQICMQNNLNILLLEDNNNFIKLGSLYTIIYENVVETILVDSINENNVTVSFLKRQCKPVKHNNICVLKETFNNNLIVGKIIT